MRPYQKESEEAPFEQPSSTDTRTLRFGRKRTELGRFAQMQALKNINKTSKYRQQTRIEL